VSGALFPSTYPDAAAALEANPSAAVIAGGTDVMVAVNEGSRRVDHWISLRRVVRADHYDADGDAVLLGAGTTFEQLLGERGNALPALAQAARTVGGPQIRAAATVGGNLATASPAGDSLPVLACYDAELQLVGATHERWLPLADFLVGPGKTDLRPGEVVAAVRLPSTAGTQHFAKVGTRNAMVISVCSLAGRLDRDAGIARLAFGSASATVRRAVEAEALLLDGAPPGDVGDALAAACSPIDDHRASAAYRRRALAVLGSRMTGWLREAEHG
jgi:CO/xanthine dehydrogenase FAD-binding subunit